MRVALVSPEGYVYPKTCPCCSAPAAEIETITGSAKEGQLKTKLAVKMPSCFTCLEHRNVGSREAMFAVVAGAIALVAGVFGKFVLAADVLFPIGVVLFALALVAAPMVRRKVRESWPQNNPRHVSVGPAVKVKPYFGEVIFDFENEDFGNAFKDMNKARLAKTS